MTREGADERLMRLAIALGDRHRGLTWPNPSVGAVLVEPGTDRILSVGITQPGGRPHAEPVALAAVGEAARGATLYVSLEPCSHHGRTPPCVDAIVASGVARVVTALEDPDPRVAGRGHHLLREAGIAVTAGVGAREAARSHQGHVSRVTRGRPWLTLKLARTRDGFAGARERRLLITGASANERSHLLRAHADAILVGVGTVLADDPRLDVRLPGLFGRSPLRVVLDSTLRTPLEAHVVATARERPTWLLCGPDAPVAVEAGLVGSGCQVIRLPASAAGRVDLAAALGELGARGITRVLCEGGPSLADALAEGDLVDDMVLLTGAGDVPVDTGSPVPALGAHLRAALGRFRANGRERAGVDLVETFERS